MRQAESSEKEYAFLQYIDCTRPLDIIVKESCGVIPRWSTTDKTDHTIMEYDIR